MRIAKISFTNDILGNTGGIEKHLIMTMLDLLPADAKIIGFKEEPSFNVSSILIVSNQFKDIPHGNPIPNIEAMLKIEPDNTVSVERLDFGDILEPTSTGKYTLSINGKVVATGVDATVKVSPGGNPYKQEIDDKELLRKLWRMR